MAKKNESTHVIMQAAAVAFGFVLIHLLKDGNGRIHRFVIRDLLTRNKLVEKGMIIPVSAHMVNQIREYDQILEIYSKPLMKRVKYEVRDNQSVMVTNADDVETITVTQT